MPTTRYTFTPHTLHDRELIEFLDSFPHARERNLWVKEVLRQAIVSEGFSEDGMFPTDRLDSLEEKLVQILREISRIRKSGVATTPEQHDMDADAQEEAEKNLRKLLGDD